VEITIFAVVKALNKNGPMVIGNHASDTRQNLDFYSINSYHISLLPGVPEVRITPRDISLLYVHIITIYR